MTATVQNNTEFEVGSLNFELILSITLGIMYIGALLDNLNHARNGDLIEGFFTPAHLVLYAGFGLSLMWMTYVLVVRVAAGQNWRKAIPPGYEMAYIGAFGFSLGGVFDMVWHEVFGVENSIDALYSTSHMFLLVFGIALASGPLIAAVRRYEQLTPYSWSDHYPALLSIGFMFVQILTFSAPFNPFRVYWIGGDEPSHVLIRSQLATDIDHRYVLEAISSGQIIFIGMFFALFFGSIALKFQFPRGGLLAVFTTIGLSFALIQKSTILIPAIVIWVVVTELLIQFLPVRPFSKNSVRNLRIHSFLIPYVLFQAIFLLVKLTEGSWLSLHLFTGFPFLAGFTGFLSSYFITTNLELDLEK